MKYVLITLICVSLFISYFVIPGSLGKTDEERSFSGNTGNAAIISDYDVKLKNLNFAVTRIEKECAIMKAEFDLESPQETPGEIYININGKYPANGRLIVKEGLAHYSIDFFLPNPEVRLLNIYMADVTLKTRGRVNDIVSGQFAMVSYSAHL